MEFDLGVAISIVSAIVAVVSAFVAWQAVKAAEKTYSIQLIGQLYATYQSDVMLHDLKIAWGLYHQIWELDSDTKEIANEMTNKGTPIRKDSAINFFKNLDVDSPEYKAIHNLINFWTYLELLLKRKALSPKEILAFTSPKLLGFLYPINKAYSARYGRNYEKEVTLKYVDEHLRNAK